MPSLPLSSRVHRLLVGAALATVSARPAPAQAPARPPAPPVFVPDACTSECCPLGRWGVRAPLAVRAAPERRAPVRFRVGPGAVLMADSSVVRVDTLGVVVMRRAYAGAGGTGELAPGDSVFVLHYGGEGTAEVWYRGAGRQVLVFWLADDPVEEARLPGALVRAPSAAWWARVRDARGRVGWVRPDPRTIRAPFNCAGP